MSPAGASAFLRVEQPGPLTTVQDRGRHGYADLGVPRAGALDAPAAALANRLVGNPPDAAVLEVTLGGLALHLDGGPRWAAVTGAEAEVVAGEHAQPWAEAFAWRDGVLRIGPPRAGMRSYLALGGGIAVEPVLGSRSRDLLAGLGPAPLTTGDRLPLGPVTGGPSGLDTPPVRQLSGLRLHPGPRADWFTDPWSTLAAGTWTVRPESNRVGLRLAGPSMVRVPDRDGTELASEGMVLGAVQVPPDGQPVVFLNDHPTTGGYPVVAVVDERDLWQCAQARPGEQVTLRGPRDG